MRHKDRRNRPTKRKHFLNGFKKRAGRSLTGVARRVLASRRAKNRLKIDRAKWDNRVMLLVYSRPRYTQYYTPSDITIATPGLTEEQIALLKKLEENGDIPPITWIISSPSSVDDRIRLALLYLHSEEAKKLKCQMYKGYDYAWLKMAFDHGKMPSPYLHLKSMSTPTFVKYIQSLGFTDIAGSKTLNKFIAQATWLSEAYIISFRGLPVAKPECDRRNNIALKFLEIVNEI